MYIYIIMSGVRCTRGGGGRRTSGGDDVLADALSIRLQREQIAVLTRQADAVLRTLVPNSDDHNLRIELKVGRVRTHARTCRTRISSHTTYKPAHPRARRTLSLMAHSVACTHTHTHTHARSPARTHSHARAHTHTRARALARTEE